MPSEMCIPILVPKKERLSRRFQQTTSSLELVCWFISFWYHGMLEGVGKEPFLCSQGKNAFLRINIAERFTVEL